MVEVEQQPAAMEEQQQQPIDMDGQQQDGDFLELVKGDVINLYKLKSE